MSTDNLAFHDLRAVAAVASHQHFGRAAQALRIPQPTLSAQVQKVERALGVPLFERTNRRFYITAHGERLLPLIGESLAAADRLTGEAAGGSLRPFRLGVIPTLGPYLVPHLLFPLQKSHNTPAAPPTLDFSEHTTPRLLEELAQGHIDAALLSIPVKGDPLATIPLFVEPFRLIAHTRSDIAKARPLAPSRLAACDMVLLEEGHCLRDQAIAVCSRRGGTSPRTTTASLETLKYLVAAGNGYSLLPALASQIPAALSKLVVIRDFDERPPTRRIGLCFRRSMTRQRDAARLADFIRANPPPGVTLIR